MTAAPNSAVSNTPNCPLKRQRVQFACEAIFLVAICMMVCWANHALLNLAIVPPSSNDAQHLDFVASYCSAMEHAPSLGQALLTTWVWPGCYPPGSYLVTYLYTLVCGKGVMPALASLTVFLVAVILTIYFTVRPRGGTLAAIAAVLAAASVPHGFLCCDHYTSDLQVGLGACLAICILLRSESFQRRGVSLLFGLALGYGLLFKANVLFFVAPALAVVLLARWREGWASPLSVLWHMMLAGAVLLACSRTSSYISGELQDDMLAYATFLTPAVHRILWLVIGIFVAWWLLAEVHWGKLRRVPALTNLSHALALAFLMFAPWALVNRHLVGNNATNLWHEMATFSQPKFFLQSLQGFYDNSFGNALLVLLVVSLLFALTKWATVEDRALALSSVVGFVVTACVLGRAPRYYFPCYLLCACCLALPLRKNKVVACVAIALGLTGFIYNSVMPAYPEPAMLSANPFGMHLPDKYASHFFHYYGTSPNECIFAKVWQICPALAAPDGRPRLVLIREDSKRISPRPGPNEFCYDPCQDMLRAVNAWSYWHNNSLIPLYLNDRGFFYRVENYAYVPYLNSARRSNPELVRALHSYLTCHSQDRISEPGYQMIAQSSFILDLCTPSAPELAEAQIAQLMQQPQLAHRQTQLQGYTIHIWSRPQDAPNPSDLTLRANRFAPHIE